MSTVPPISRCLLDDLRPESQDAQPAGADPTPVTRAFMHVEVALDAYLAALAALDRIEEALVTTHGYPRVPVPGPPPAYAADAVTIVRRLGPGPTARRLTTALRRQQARFAEAAKGAGLDAARAREARTAADLSAAAALLLAPVQARTDLAVKLAVLIAAGEATADDALAFPWLFLRALHADLSVIISSP